VRILVAGAVVLVMLFGVGCGGESSEKENSVEAPQETRQENGVTVEETTAPRETTEATTGFEFSVGRSPMDEESPEDVLALQYEYINRGDFEQAYSLFAERSRSEVSLAQYKAFFEDNAPYSVTDYSFSPAEIEGDSASVDAEFTVTSASGVERLERTQEFVRESGDWRVVMRPEQVAAFTVGEDDTDADPTPEPVTKTGDLDCGDFDYQEDAQAVYEQDTSDPNGLDGQPGESYTGEQGEACEDLPNRASAPSPVQKSQSPRPRFVSPEPPPAPAATGVGATPPVGGDCPSEAPIKGNASSRIYHVPGGQFYDRTNAEECFASESSAQDAGYRASQR
jgi:hypothetical protein